MDLRSLIRVIPGFPEPGVSFKDITTLLKDPQALRYVVQEMARHYRDKDIDVITGIESRGFFFSAPLAYEMGLGLVPIRKPGKLPADKLSIQYALEYGTDALEIHRDAIVPGQRVLLVDDLLATGGTFSAAVQLIRQLGGIVVGGAFLVELASLGGRKRLGDIDVFSLVVYDD
ncbi:MAG: adenine phosphoribosyltransferase [Firmicutes bacterium]|jgi:adenine phosphoribosyltransferase|nr:adenine phosphoribosyltransferase [Bacillota bacterium]